MFETMQSPVERRPPDDPLFDAWFELNYRLQEEAIETQINKTFVQQWMMRLGTIKAPRPQCFWLFLARINELALLCTSRYVDCCEIAFADELLKGSGTVPFDVKEGRPVPRKDNIHPAAILPCYAVSQDGGGRPGKGRKPIPAETKSRPLLPYLYDLLKGSGYMTDHYLLSVSRRTEKIEQVAGMLEGLGMGNMEEMSVKLSSMDDDQRRYFRSRLCLFDLKTFNELGRALHLLMRFWDVDDKYVRKYLCR